MGKQTVSIRLQTGVMEQDLPGEAKTKKSAKDLRRRKLMTVVRSEKCIWRLIKVAGRGSVERFRRLQYWRK